MDNLFSMSKEAQQQQKKIESNHRVSREQEAAAAWGEDRGWGLVMPQGQRASLLGWTTTWEGLSPRGHADAL